MDWTLKPYTYLDLIAEASDPTLLDRAVASLSYGDWVQYGDGSPDQFRKVYTRLMSTDTTFRVKETVAARIGRFSEWIHERRREMEENRENRADQDRWTRQGDVYWMARSKEREEEAEKEEEEKGRAIQVTEFFLGQRIRTDTISQHFTPTWENCTFILHLLTLPFDQFIAKCLCINDQNVRFGNHDDIFYRSVEHCDYLLRAAKRPDDVTHISKCAWVGSGLIRSVQTGSEAAPISKLPDACKDRVRTVQTGSVTTKSDQAGISE
ncbi:hypothetical protein SISSUDRAFT_1067975 [Sistotremastrum suecicum HHB10207 ss-3]|uniref:Uncharacterized protein n=1 Tax=Sistotremastrum suecicum HHB10207 ss-3 TaxID=1314776 RepID=A0A165WIQ6_9AGAM|nr:hypothetical protein SISSUDRAFT_1067975 [Sistotremastrum suecicum HHB10207 ss-3]